MMDRFSFEDDPALGSKLPGASVPGFPGLDDDGLGGFFGASGPAPSPSPTPAPATPAAPVTGGTGTPSDWLAATSLDTSAGTPGSTPSSTPDASKVADTKAYADTLARIRATADPAEQAVLKDQLARTLFRTLTDSGHDVKWDGDNLIVDGRPYVIGSGTGGTGNSGVSGLGTSSAAGGKGYAPIAGFDFDKLSGAKPFDSAQKYSDAVRTFSQGLHSGVKIGRNDLEGMVAYARANGFPNAKSDGVHKIDFGDGEGPIDVITSTGGIWFQNGADRFEGGGGGGMGGGIPASLASFESSEGMIEEPTYATGAAAPTWTPTAPEYAPDLDGILFGDAGPTEGLTEDLVARLLKNPESLDALTVEKMKARSKDELGEMAELEDDTAMGRAIGMGIDDSKWFAADRSEAARGRDQALVGKNRDIEIQAATTNMADRRAAADLGLRTAALTGDRLALRASIDARARELGLAGDEMQLRYTLGLMEEETKRTGQKLDFQKARASLAQAGREFQEELALRYAQLSQDDAQFGASYGLDHARLEHDIDEDHYKRWADTATTDD